MADLGVLAPLFAKLIGLGMAAWEAAGEEGWGKGDAKALAEALALVSPALAAVPGKPAPKEIQYYELILVAFGEAWRRHWYYDERLAPKSTQSSWTDWFRPEDVQRRVKQVEARLRQARFSVSGLGDGTAGQQLEVLGELLGDPVASRFYRALWEVFSDRELDQQGEEPLLFRGDGNDRRAFERHFRLAFREALCSPRAKELRGWLLEHERSESRAELVRELLASSLLNLKEQHVFGGAGDSSEIPNMPLAQMYVEPFAQLGHPPKQVPANEPEQSATESEALPPEPVVSLIEGLLQDDATRVLVVTAPFGMGKSLTARTLAYRLAERFLEGEKRTTDLDFPVLIRAQDSLRAEEFDLDKVVRRAQKQLAEPLLPKADIQHDGFGLPPAEQRCVVILDGLDEVRLSPDLALDLFKSLREAATSQHRFIVLGRPQVVSEQALKLPGVAHLTLCEFTHATDGVSQVQRWLDNWSRLNTERPAPTLTELEERALLDLCATPILLFMASVSWQSLSDEKTVQRRHIYRSFIELLARSKLQQDGEQPVVQKSAEKLRERLVEKKELAANASPVDAMIWLLACVAWKAHVLRESSTDAQLTSDDVRDILRSQLQFHGEDLELVELGLLLTMHANPSGGARDLRFTVCFRQACVASPELGGRLPTVSQRTRFSNSTATIHLPRGGSGEVPLW